MHRNLAGNRYSDHIALLNAFQQYERERYTCCMFIVLDKKYKEIFFSSE